MKLQRIIYKSHLLPPFLCPYNLISKFVEDIHPQTFENIRNLRAPQRIQHYEKLRNQYTNFNNVAFSQLQKYRQKFISPLNQCPTYEQQLHYLIKFHLNISTDIKAYTSRLKRTNKEFVLSSFMTKYSKFKRSLNQQFFEQVRFVPPCLYHSVQELVYDRLEDWEKLDEARKYNYQIEFIQYLQGYAKELENCIKDERGINTVDLLQLKKKQFNIDLHQTVREILFQ